MKKKIRPEAIKAVIEYFEDPSNEGMEKEAPELYRGICLIVQKNIQKALEPGKN